MRRTAAGRYDMHPVVRQYAHEKLVALGSPFDAAIDAHSRYFLELLCAQEDSLHANAQRASIEMLMAENENLRAAWTNATQHAEWMRLERALDALSLFYDMTSQFRAARGLLEQTFAAMETESFADAQFTRASVQAHLAYFCARLSDSAHARELAETARVSLAALATETRRERAFCLNTLAKAANDTGDEARAEKLSREGLALRREIQDHPGTLASLLSLGRIMWQRGAFDSFRDLMQEGCALARALGDRWSTARFLHGLGAFHVAQDNLKEALHLFSESLTLYQALGDAKGAAEAMINVGEAYSQGMELERARTVLEAALDVLQDLGDRFGIGSCLIALGGVVQEQGDSQTATRYFSSALELFRAINAKYGECHALKGLGEAASSHQPAQAQIYLVQALQIATETQFVPASLEIILSIAQLAEQQGNAARAVQLVNAVMQHPAAYANTRAAGEKILARVPRERAVTTISYEDLVRELVPMQPA